MTYKLATPLSVGDPLNPIQVTELILQSVSVSFQQNPPNISVVLGDPNSWWQTNIVYAADSVSGLVGLDAIFNLLINDKKLPAGTLTS